MVCLFMLHSCIIQNPKKENCEQIEIKVTEIYEGGIKDIVFSAPDRKYFYISRGLEQSLTIEGMKNKVLNKKLTLHLAKIITGTSNHIAQLSLGQEVIFTEFN